MDFASASDRLCYELALHGLPMQGWYRTVYLASPHWHDLRQQVFDAQGRECSKCHATKGLDVHHLNYHQIFDVQPLDLQVLCRRCHEQEHSRALPSGAQWPPARPKGIPGMKWGKWLRRMDRWIKMGRYSSGAPPRFPRVPRSTEKLVLPDTGDRRLDRIRDAHASFVAEERRNASTARLLSKSSRALAGS